MPLVVPDQCPSTRPKTHGRVRPVAPKRAEIREVVPGPLLTTQSFLLTVAAILSSNTTLLWHYKGISLIILSLAAIVLGQFLHIAVKAARTEQSRLRGEEKEEEELELFKKIFDWLGWNFLRIGLHLTKSEQTLEDLKKARVRDKPDYNKVFKLTAIGDVTEEDLRASLQARGATLVGGHSYVTWLHWTTTVVWLFVLLLGLLDVIGVKIFVPSK